MSKYVFPKFNNILRHNTFVCMHNFSEVLVRLSLLYDSDGFDRYVHYGRWENL